MSVERPPEEVETNGLTLTLTSGPVLVIAKSTTNVAPGDNTEGSEASNVAIRLNGPVEFIDIMEDVVVTVDVTVAVFVSVAVLVTVDVESENIVVVAVAVDVSVEVEVSVIGALIIVWFTREVEVTVVVDIGDSYATVVVDVGSTC